MPSKLSRLPILLGALAVIGLAPLAVVAQGDPIAERKATMRKVGGATREPGAMLKGDQPFDLAKVQATLATYQDAAKRMPALFPEGTRTGGETKAAPKIWEDRADFTAKWGRFGQDAAEAAASIKDEASFKAAMPNVLRNCGGCHQVYQLKG